MIKKLLLTAALAVGLASAAHADPVPFIATGIDTPDHAGGSFSIGLNGYSNYAGPISLTNAQNQSILVYCLDLYNVLTVPTTYTYATFDNFDVNSTHLSAHGPVTLDLVKIAAIANWGFDKWAAGDGVAAAAAQLAIWSVEYGGLNPHLAVGSTELSEFTMLTGNFSYADIGKKIDLLIPNDSSQVMITQLASPVPEPATWFMMILGFSGVGLMGMRKRRQGQAFRLA